MQGTKALFKDIIDTYPQIKRPSGKGRSPELDNKRNALLSIRYCYYLALHNRWTYEAVISELSKEFYLSTRTITNILSSNLETILQLKKKMPPVAQLKREYPHLVWK